MIKKFLISIALLTVILSLLGCGGSGGGHSSAPGGVNPGIPSIVKLLDVQNIVQTNTLATFKARVFDGTGVPVKKNHTVIFTNLSSIGVWQPPSTAITTAITDDNGYATAYLKSNEPGFATVQAEVNSGAGQVRDRRTVFFTPGSLNLSPFMILDVDGDDDGIFNEPDDFIFLQNENDTDVIIRATVFDRFGLPEPLTGVLFGADVPYRVGSDQTCNDGSDTCEIVFPDGVDRITDSNGQAFVRVRVEPQALRTIQTLFNVLSVADNGAFNMLTLFLEPIFIGSVNLTADPLIVETGGTSDITAAVKTTLNAPAPDGTVVSFTATCGVVEPFAQTTDGVAAVEFTAPATPGTCTITGTTGGVSDSVSVTAIIALVVNPDSVTIDTTIGGTATYTIMGGVPPYRIFTDDPALPPSPSTVGSSGGTFSVTVPAGEPAKTVTYTIMDATGETVTATLEIEAAGALTITPDTVDITDGGSPQTLIFQVTGGIPGYDVISSNPALAFNDDGAGGGTAGNGLREGAEGGTWSVADEGDVFTVTIPANAVTADSTVILTVIDSSSNITSATITVTDEPAP